MPVQLIRGSMTKKEEFEIETLHKLILSYGYGNCHGFEWCKGCRDIAESLQKAVETERNHCADIAETGTDPDQIATAIRERQKGKL